MVSTFAFLRTSFPISGIAHGTKIFLCIGTPFRSGFGKILSDSPPKYQPIRLPDLILRLRSGQAPGVCSGLILSGAFYPDLKIGVWRRRTYQNVLTTFTIFIKDILDHFDTLYVKLDILETEYHAINAGISRIEKQLEGIEKRFNGLEKKLDTEISTRELLEKQIAVLKERVSKLQERIEEIDLQLKSHHDSSS